MQNVAMVARLCTNAGTTTPTELARSRLFTYSGQLLGCCNVRAIADLQSFLVSSMTAHDHSLTLCPPVEDSCEYSRKWLRGHSPERAPGRSFEFSWEHPRERSRGDSGQRPLGELCVASADYTQRGERMGEARTVPPEQEGSMRTRRHSRVVTRTEINMANVFYVVRFSGGASCEIIFSSVRF